ncbi:MAG: metallophosphoesterase family protein [Methylocystaceae bacterium]
MPTEKTADLRLNEQASQIVASRQGRLTFKERFALVFLGDTHIGKQCNNDIDCSLMYTRLLQSVLSNQIETRDILAIIHGGDGTHRGGQHLEEFVYLTRHALNWDLPDENYIPLFMNIGNHEYMGDPDGEQYRQWVADPLPLQSTWFDDLRWGVVLLNTGMNDRGYLPEGQFAKALSTIEQLIESHRGYQLIIDMHIPPAIGFNARRYLVLNHRDTKAFKQLLQRYPKSIAAVVSHHRHWAKMTDQPYRFRGRTPCFISAYGGHCDCPRFSCLKLFFERQPGGGWVLSSQLLHLRG